LFSITCTATTEISTLSLHDALPIYVVEVLQGGLEVGAALAHQGGELLRQPRGGAQQVADRLAAGDQRLEGHVAVAHERDDVVVRSEEHTSELQSRENLVCRLLLEKK